jgi:hypothetical protein
MKFSNRSKLYSASNVTFNPETCQANSYGWWTFVKVIHGKVIFNSYRYSNTTSKHQYRVRSLLSKLGIKIDREVKVRGGLQNISTLKELNAAENETLAVLEITETTKRKARNERARARRFKLKLEKLHAERDESARVKLLPGGAA